MQNKRQHSGRMVNAKKVLHRREERHMTNGYVEASTITWCELLTNAGHDWKLASNYVDLDAHDGQLTGKFVKLNYIFDVTLPQRWPL